MSLPIADYAGEIVGEVEYTENLDYLSNGNWTCGSTGHHKGLAMHGDKYILIHGTNWQGEQDSAEIISAHQACQEILKSGNAELFENFPELQIEREKLQPQKGKKETIHLRIEKEKKKRWQGQAESKGISLASLINAAMEKYLAE